MLQLLSDESALRLEFEDRFESLNDHLEELIDQPHLLQLAFERIEDAHLDRNPELDDFNFALVLFYVKVVIDALDGEF